MLHICLATDFRYVDYTMMCVHDIVLRKNPETELTFYILLDSPREKERSIASIEEMLEKIHELDDLPDTTIVPIIINTESMCEGRPEFIGHLSQTMFARVLIPELKELQNVHRLLWVDSDVLCRRDLTDLYNMDLKGNPVGAVRASILLSFYDPQTVPWRYSDVNTGVLLMDLDKLREMGYTDLMLNNLYGNNKKTFEHVFYDVMKEHIALLPPTVQVPYHNFVRNTINLRTLCQINRWNEYHNTNYSDFHELFDNAYFFHFHESKSLYLRSPQIRTIFFISQKRLEYYLNTKQIMSWEPKDDRVFLDPCEDIIFSAIDLLNSEITASANAERVRLGTDAPDATEWTFFFNKIYHLCSHNLSSRITPSYHEMRRVGMMREDISSMYVSTRSYFDEVIYRGMDHTEFDKLIGSSDRYGKLNQMLAYHDLFCKTLDSGIERVLICEDDVLFRNSTKEIRDIFDHLPPNWDYIKFGKYNGPEEIRKYQSSMTIGEYFHKNYTGGYLGMVCCAYSRKAMETAIQIMESQLLPMDYILENRDDDRLTDLRRYVSAINIAMEAGRDIQSYNGIAVASDFWSTEEYKALAGKDL